MSQAQTSSGPLDQEVSQSPGWAVSTTFTPQHLYLQAKLQPLLQVEQILLQSLSPHGDVDATRMAATPKLREVSVNALSSWKGVLSKLVHGDFPEGQSVTTTETSDIARIISAQKENIRVLWADPLIRSHLKKRKLRIEDLPGLYALSPPICCIQLN